MRSRFQDIGSCRRPVSVRCAVHTSTVKMAYAVDRLVRTWTHVRAAGAEQAKVSLVDPCDSARMPCGASQTAWTGVRRGVSFAITGSRHPAAWMVWGSNTRLSAVPRAMQPSGIR